MAHEGPQRPRSQLSIAEDFEWKSQNHEEIGNDCVLKKNNEVGFTADLKENPHCQAVGDESDEKQDSIEQGEEDLVDFVISGAETAVPSRNGEVVHGFPFSFSAAWFLWLLKALNVSSKW